MSGANLCRLCIKMCSDYIALDDENGRINRTYEITVKYFDPMFLKVDQGVHLTVMCLECWHHISEFHNFRQSVLLAQAKLLEDDKLAAVVLELHAGIQIEKCSESATCVVEENQFNSAPERGVVELPSPEGSNDNCTKEIQPTQINDHLESVVECPGQECNHNIFLADEAGLIPLVKLTPKIKFTEFCMRTTEPISQSFIANSRDNNVGNISSIDGIDNLSQDYEGPHSSCAEEVSEYEFEWLYSDNSCTNNDILIPNYKPKLKGASEGPKLNATKEIVATDGAGISQDGEQTECTPKSLATKTLASIYQDNVEPKDVSEQQLIKRTREEELDEDCNKLLPFKSSLRRYRRKEHTTVAENNAQQKYIRKAYETHALTPRECDVLIAQWKPNLECENCSEIFPSYTLLRLHFSEEHREEEFYTLCCETKFKTRVLFTDHVQLHLDPNAFKCEFCGQRYTRNIQLLYHILQQHGAISNKNYISQYDHGKDPSAGKKN